MAVYDNLFRTPHCPPPQPSRAIISSRARRVGCALAGVLALVACSRTGELSGDLFVTMKSGDVKRGAAVEIVLIPATEQFESEWNKTVDQFKLDYASAKSAFQQADEARDRAFQRSLDSIRTGFGRSSYETEEEQATTAARHVDEVEERYRAMALKVIETAHSKIVRTDVNGHYVFSAVPAGKYYIFARHVVFDNVLYWLTPTEVKSGANRVDLSNENAVRASVRLDTFLRRL